VTVPLEPVAKVMGAVSPAPNSRTALLAIVKAPLNAAKLPSIVRRPFWAAIVPVPLMLPVIVAFVLSVRDPLSVIVSDSAFDPV
jgi:hypothetical protein